MVVVARITEMVSTVHRSRESGCAKLDCWPGGGGRKDISHFSFRILGAAWTLPHDIRSAWPIVLILHDLLCIWVHQASVEGGRFDALLIDWRNLHDSMRDSEVRGTHHGGIIG